MQRFNRLLFVTPLVVLVLMFGAVSLSMAQEEPTAMEVARSNNPIADMRALNIQDYYIPKLYGLDDEIANTFWVRAVYPTGPILWRASMPLKTVPTAMEPASGLGDIDVFAAYLAVNKPTLTVGIGPQIVFPTASEDALGTGKWQLGVAAVVYGIVVPQWQLGGLVTWQTSIAGDENRDDTSVLAAQPFSIWQLGGGTYLRTAPIWVFDLKSGDYHIPLGFGIGQVVKVNKTVFNIFIEPQFTILHSGVGQPAFQIYTGCNMQFIK